MIKTTPVRDQASFPAMPPLHTFSFLELILRQCQRYLRDLASPRDLRVIKEYLRENI